MFQVLNSKFSNQYYLIKGEVGTGKTRLIVETVRELIKQQNATREGAPVYVAVAQVSQIHLLKQWVFYIMNISIFVLFFI